MDACLICKTPLPDPRDGVPTWLSPATLDGPPNARLCDGCYLENMLGVSREILKPESERAKPN